MKKQIIAIGLCMVMGISLVGCGTGDTSKSVETEAKAEEKKLQETLEEKAAVKSGSGKYEKEETVYLLSDENGKVKDTIVSEWLKNNERTETMEDKSNLAEIKNVKGDETFETGENNSLTWKAEGADIYYQGTSDKESPVEVRITYKLDGKEISAKDLAGKSGKLSMHFEYTNRASEEEDYTPFLMVTGMILPGEKFSNIEVENGKLISDGNNNIVVGYGMPGLSESLKLNELGEKMDVSIPESFEVSAEVKDFELSMTMTVATADFMNDIDTDDLNLNEVFDELDSKILEFTDGTDELFKGIKEYTAGVGEVAEGTTDLKAATATMKNGAKKLKAGTKSAKDGVSKLDTGAAALNSGAKSAKAGSAKLKAGYEGSKGAVAGAKALSNGLSTLNQKVSSLNLPTISANSSMNAQEQQAVADEITAKITASLPAAVQSYLAQAGINDPQTLGAVQTAYMAAYKQAYSQAFQDGIKYGASYTVRKVNETVASMAGSITELKTGVSQLATGSAQLYSGISQLYTGTKQLDAGIGILKSGTAELKAGTGELAKGSNTLDKGEGELAVGATKLDKGAAKLKAGADKLDKNSAKLVDGSKALKDGTEKLSDTYEEKKEDITKLTDRVKAIINAGKDYQSFAGKADDKTGSVKFIIKTDAIAK